MRNRKKPHGDTYKFILMTLLREGPLDFSELEKRLTVLVNQFMLLGYAIIPNKLWLNEDYHYGKRKQRTKEDFDVRVECEDLIKKIK